MYQVVFTGKNDPIASEVRRLLTVRLAELGLENAIEFYGEHEGSRPDRRLPTVAIFVGYDGATDGQHTILNSLLDDSILIIPIVSDLARVGMEVPQSLRHINAIEVHAGTGHIERIVSLILEEFRLLRRERRIFISYKRNDSQAVANQLYDHLDAHGFDVFIDTSSVPPAADFQSQLWHRLSDSDVVVLIDTPHFRSSRWTTEELARANATNIQILHLLWPGQNEDGESAFSYFYRLEASSFEGGDCSGDTSRLKTEVADLVCNHVERLRARAISVRQRYLVDSFCDAARDKGLQPAVQPQRWISISVASHGELAVVPTIGVPTSDRINAVFDSISNAGSGTAGTWVLYDDRGLLTSWMQHLDWLDRYLPVRSVKMVAANRALDALMA